MLANLDLSNSAALSIAVIATATILSLASVPVVRALARRFGIVDAPDPERKLHHGEIALCGGIAVFFATCVTVALLFFLQGTGEVRMPTLPWDSRWTALVAAAAAIVTLGLIDDWITLRGRQKLLGQVLIVSFLAASGTSLQHVDLLGWHLDLGVFAMPITILWLLGCLNALNLIDGADGMATTTGAIVAAGLGAMAMMRGMPLTGTVAFALAGALLGFLAYNRPPASIFLGDAGSMMIGLVIGTLAIWGSVKESTVVAVAPVVALSLPLFDSVIAILRRVLTGRSLYAADRAHLHHRLLTRHSHSRMLLIVAALCGITTLAAVTSIAFGQQWIGIAGAGIVLGSLVLTRSFGNAELKMLLTRGSHFGESFLTRSHRCEETIRHKAVQLQGTRSWETIWQGLTEFAEKHDLARIKLDLNLSWLHEGFHGSWQRVRLPDKIEQLVLKMPVMVNERQVGKLEIVGNGCHPGIIQSLEVLASRLHDLQPDIARLLEEAAAAEAAAAAQLAGSPRKSVPHAGKPGRDAQRLPAAAEEVVDV